MKYLSVVVNPAEPCAGCHGRCCVEHRVNVDGFDVVRLVRARGAAWDEIVELERVDHPLYLGFRLDAGAAHWLMYLRREANGACRFLVGPDDALRCGVYAARPGACRVYPAALDDGRAFFSAHAICPAERAAAWAARLAAGDATARDDEAARRLYAHALARWDGAVLRGPRRVDDFVRWIGEVLDAVGVFPALDDEAAMVVAQVRIDGVSFP